MKTDTKQSSPPPTGTGPALLVDRDDFLSAVRAVGRVADPKSSMPILAHVLLTVTGGKLRVAATNLNQTALSLIPCEARGVSQGSLDGKEATAPAKLLRDLLGKLPKGSVGLECAPSALTLVGSNGSTVKLQGLPPRDFPRLPTTPPALHPVADVRAFREALESVAPYISTDETRYHLNGLCFTDGGRGHTRLVATDGHRLGKLDLEAGLPPLGKDRLVPRPVVLDLIQLLKGCERLQLGWGKDQHLYAQVDNLLYVAKLADAQFPPYGQVIPRDSERAVEVDRLALLQIVRQSVLVAADKTAGLSLLLNRGVLRVQADNPDLGESSTDLAASYGGETFSIGVNGIYLDAALRALHEPQVTIKLNGALDPLLIQGPRGTFVIMPMRIDYSGSFPAPRDELPAAPRHVPAASPRLARPAPAAPKVRPVVHAAVPVAPARARRPKAAPVTALVPVQTPAALALPVPPVAPAVRPVVPAAPPKVRQWKLYGGVPYQTPAGMAWLYNRGGQQNGYYRFYDAQGVQVGPQLGNIRDALAHAEGQQWRYLNGERDRERWTLPQEDCRA